MAEEGTTKPVLEMVQADGADEGCVTFVMHDEDHTLGNSLRYMVMKNEDVEFCGYTITHPSENKINFRIQTKGGVPAAEALRKGLSDLHEVCQHVLNTFELQMLMNDLCQQKYFPKYDHATELGEKRISLVERIVSSLVSAIRIQIS